ncbi:MAG: phosphate/phosphonate ABC transporter permease [Halapricum sp.]
MATADGTPSAPEPHVEAARKHLWRRRQLRRVLYLTTFLGVIGLTYFVFLDFLGFSFAQLTTDRATTQMGKFVNGLFPPNFEDMTTYTKANEITGLEALVTSLTAWEFGLLWGVIPGLWPTHITDTLAQANAGNGNVLVSAAYTTVAAGFAGTVLGFPLALVFGVLGSERVIPFPFNFLFRGTMSTIRAIPAIVWTLIYIPIFGISPATGVLAITTDTIGNLGRLFTDELEEIGDGPIEAVRSTGGGRVQVVVFGMLSQVTNSFIAWTLYILEINTRIAITLGVLGVGGLGMYIDNQLGLLDAGYQNAMAGIFMVVFIVLSIELVSSRIRARLRPGEDAGKTLFGAVLDLADPGKWIGRIGGRR